MLYTGLKSTPSYPPFYGAADPYHEGPGSPASGRENLRYDMPRGPQGSVATLGGLGAVVAPGTSPFVYALASLVGAGVGGALVGYVASEKRGGAIRGAAFAAGLAALSDAYLFFTTDRAGTGLVVGAVGAGGIGWALRDMRRR